MTAWTGIGPALQQARPGQRMRLWGRVRDGRLLDATGSAVLVPPPADGVGAVLGTWSGAHLQVERVHLRPTGPLDALGPAVHRVPAIAARFDLVRALRRSLEDRGYREAPTPLLLEAPGTDPFIEPVPASLARTWNPAAPQGRAWLHTSPELELKRLLALGFPAIYQLCPVFRQGDLSRLHEPEFLMAEWYRVGWTADELGQEVAELCDALAGTGAARVCTVAELCRTHAGVEVLELQQGTALSDAMQGPPEPFVHAFSRLWVDHVEPALADQGAVLLTRWPAALGMLARRDPDDARVALRFELVVDGVELANGFDELTDPVEQRARFEAELALRRAEGLPLPPLPERFLQALEAGLPPCAGVALGVDRLAMVAAGERSLAEALASPACERFSP